MKLTDAEHIGGGGGRGGGGWDFVHGGFRPPLQKVGIFLVANSKIWKLQLIIK